MKKRSIVKESLADSIKIRKMAEAVARKKIIEELTPSIRNLVENQINNAMQKSEDTDRLRRAADGYGETEFEEGKRPEGDEDMEDDEKDLEEIGLGLEAMFPHLAEMEDEGDSEEELPPRPRKGKEDMDEYGLAYEALSDEEDEMEMPAEMSIPTLGEGEEGDMEDMDEDLTIDENELRKAYESMMRANSALSEAQVSSGFKDSYPSSEWETEDSPPGDTGLMDKEGGDKEWEKVKPKAAQDYQVKEAIEKGLRENSALRHYVNHLEEQLSAAKTVVGRLKEEVSNVNLFNMKVLRVNEMLNKFGKRLTVEQKKVVVEKIDSAKTVREVKMVAEALNASFKTVGSISEGRRKPKANASRARSGGSPKVLRESVDRDGNQQYSRMRELAGLLK